MRKYNSTIKHASLIIEEFILIILRCSGNFRKVDEGYFMFKEGFHEEEVKGAKFGKKIY